MRIGIVGDVHLPFAHPLYLEFCSDTFEAWQVDHIHFIGDVVDAHALGFWDLDPHGMSAEHEAQAALDDLEEWKQRFTKATVSIGNHDERHFRKARKAGIPDRYLKGYSHVFDTNEWDWQFSHKFDHVLYEHGTGASGRNAAMSRAIEKRTSLVMGHTHVGGGVQFHANDDSRIFALNAGCGIDCDAYAFSYGRCFAVRPILGCGVVIDGVHAFFEAMPCGVKEVYHRSRAGTKKIRKVKPR